MTSTSRTVAQPPIARANIALPRFSTSNLVIGACAVAATCLVVSASGAGVGLAYHLVSFGSVGDVWLQTAFAGIGIGLLYAAQFLGRNGYTIPAYLGGKHDARRIFYAWNVAFVVLLVLAFLTQTTLSISRATTVAFYLVGLLALLGLEGSIRRIIVAGLATGRLQPRRVMLVGSRVATEAMARRLSTSGRREERVGVRVVAVADLGSAATDMSMASRLDDVVATARALLPDEIVIAAPEGEGDVVEAVVRAFEQLPVAIHLDGGALLGRFGDIHLRRVGGVATVAVAELPLTGVQVVLKRAFDIVGAAIALLLAAPVFAVVALLIRRDSPGPVFFLQERHGFNLETFRIYKFRTMAAARADTPFVQATVGDARITRIGKFLRRTSLDELPQLINVLKGDMSLVGPRPHPVALDRDFGRRIRRYPRRLNMKPGITGWAQVNGLRGQTDTEEKMKHRVEADLYYIDNWSLLLDVYILMLTVLSPKTFSNAG